jgi:hypothetical protein
LANKIVSDLADPTELKLGKSSSNKFNQRFNGGVWEDFHYIFSKKKNAKFAWKKAKKNEK